MTDLWRRLCPWSLGLVGRIGLLVLGAVIITQAISVALFFFEGNSSLMVVRGARPIAEQIATLYRRIDALTVADRPDAIRLASTPLLGLEWPAPRPDIDVENDGRYAPELRDLVHADLGDSRRTIAVEPIANAGYEVHATAVLHSAEVRVFRGPKIKVSMPLSDGTWLAFYAPDWIPPRFPLLEFLPRVLLLCAITVVLFLWIAKQFTSPIVRLAMAAERLGLDGREPPLVERGAPEVRAATRAFNEMRHRLKRLVADRTQVLAAISHDLRTPLTRLRLRVEFVEDLQLQEKMLADLAEMEAMVASTLAFAKNDVQSEPREAIDLAALLQSLSEDMTDCGQAVSYDGPAHATVQARPVALRRSLMNLLNNAVNYGRAARVRLAEAAGGAVVEIDDDGPGIPPEEQEEVFSPYYRLERSRNRETGGTGLGLSIARGIIRAEGGNIELANRPEGGLRVRVTLPG
ncbi:MAG TPA: ATP-binding protein [Stellaceae bacterium]|nr:ATP-binding protein [Stellaceae bacterium]